MKKTLLAFALMLAVPQIFLAQQTDLAHQVTGVLPYGNGGWGGTTGACSLNLSTGAITCTASGVTLDTNGAANSLQNLLNFLTSTVNGLGLIVTPSNPSGGQEKFEVSGATGLTSSEGDLLGVNSSGAMGLNAPSAYSLATIHGAITPGDCTSWYSATAIQDAGACGGSGSVVAPIADTAGAISLQNSVAVNVTSAYGTDTAYFTASGGAAGNGNVIVGDAQGGAKDSGVALASLSPVASTHSCVIDNDTQSDTALVAANFSGRCAIPAASTIVEVDVIGGTGVLTGTPAAPTVTGTGSVQIGIYRPAGSSPTDAILSAALATTSGKACALPTAGSATCGIMGITQAGSSLSISTTALNKGDVLYVSAATPDAAQTWYTVTVYILY